MQELRPDKRRAQRNGTKNMFRSDNHRRDEDRETLKQTILKKKGLPVLICLYFHPDDGCLTEASYFLSIFLCAPLIIPQLLYLCNAPSSPISRPYKTWVALKNPEKQLFCSVISCILFSLKHQEGFVLLVISCCAKIFSAPNNNE